MPPADSGRTIWYLPSTTSAEVNGAAVDAFATLASVSARDTSSARFSTTFAVAGGISVLAFWSGISNSGGSLLRVLPPHVEHTRSLKCAGHVIDARFSLTCETRAHSTHS